VGTTSLPPRGARHTYPLLGVTQSLALRARIFTCEPGAKEMCLEVIDKIPTYPFAYYFLAKCLKKESDNSWVEIAEKAKEILERTTQMVGHKTDHDNFLREVTNLLE